jgi:hypothetical protein
MSNVSEPKGVPFIPCTVPCEYCQAQGYQKLVTNPSETRVFETGATRDTDDGKLDYEGFIAPEVWEEFAKYMHECRLRNIPPGEQIRSSDNWRKGIPQSAYMKSMIRHVMEAWKNWKLGTVDIKVFLAILFNVQGMVFEELKKRNA